MLQQDRKSQLSPKLTPKSIAEGEVKKFKLLKAGQVDPATGLPTFNAGAIFTGVATVYDTEWKRNVLIKNIVGQTVAEKDGKQVTEEIVEDIEFDNSGMCYVRHTEPEKYLFMCRHDACKTNPFRQKSKPALWEEIIPVNIKEAQKFNMDLEFDALTTVKNLEAKDIIALAETLAIKKLIDVNVSGKLSDVRFEVEKYCKVNPTEVIKASKAKLPKIKLDIQDAIAMKEIEFESENNEWVWSNKHGKSKTILSVTPSHDPIDSLATFLLKEEEENASAPADKKKQTTLKAIKDTLKELPV
jgi:hypothetical protein